MSPLFPIIIPGNGKVWSDKIAEIQHDTTENECAAIALLGYNPTFEFYIHQDTTCYLGDLSGSWNLVDIELQSIKLHNIEFSSYIPSFYTSITYAKTDIISAIQIGAGSTIEECVASFEINEMTADYFYLKDNACFYANYSKDDNVTYDYNSNYFVPTYHVSSSLNALIENKTWQMLEYSNEYEGQQHQFKQISKGPEGCAFECIRHPDCEFAMSVQNNCWIAGINSPSGLQIQEKDKKFDITFTYRKGMAQARKRFVRRFQSNQNKSKSFTMFFSSFTGSFISFGPLINARFSEACCCKQQNNLC